MLQVSRRRDLVPIVAVAVIVALVTYRIAAARVDARFPHWALEEFAEDLNPLIAHYGAEKNSQLYEELMIRDFFQDKRDGVFLDVGAFHYKSFSNTFYLETALGWSGIAVEPQTEYAADYARHRPRTQFAAMFASDTAGGKIPLFVPPTLKGTASANSAFTAKYEADARSIVVPTTTLNALLEQAGITKIDFMNMDIELHEPKALAGFDIRRYRPSLVCIESHAPVRQAILD